MRNNKACPSLHEFRKRRLNFDLRSRIDGACRLVQITENTERGLYASAAKIPDDPVYMKIAPASEVKSGGALLYSDIRGNGVEPYTVSIQKLYSSSGSDLLVKITDQRLLDFSGGIVQGMSGSPIVQSGRLVGAVTHVFVNDPTRGYGIFIENMLAEAEKTK